MKGICGRSMAFEVWDILYLKQNHIGLLCYKDEKDAWHLNTKKNRGKTIINKIRNETYKQRFSFWQKFKQVMMTELSLFWYCYSHKSLHPQSIPKPNKKIRLHTKPNLSRMPYISKLCRNQISTFSSLFNTSKNLQYYPWILRYFLYHANYHV